MTFDEWMSKERRATLDAGPLLLREAYEAGKAEEREACREVVEECIRTQAHLASNAREALSEASARIYKRGRA